MSSHLEASSSEKHHPAPALVEVKLNGEPRQIPGGEYTGAALKRTLGLPPGHELELVRRQKFEPIADDDKLKIRGGEEFVSHCGQGQSS